MKYKRIIAIVLLAVLTAGSFFVNGEKGYAAEKQWETETTMPTGRIVFQAHAAGDSIYLIGGRNADQTQIVTALDIYNTKTKAWSAGAAIPTAFISRVSVLAGNKIYLMGGHDINRVLTGNMVIYDIASNTWSTGAVMPHAADAVTASVIGDKIYVIGTTKDGNYIQIYDITTNSWTSKNLGFSINFATSQAYDGKVYVIGGMKDAVDRELFNQVRIYDPVNDTWTNGTSMTVRRSTMTSTIMNNKIYVIGGVVDNQVVSRTDKVEVYDLQSDTWELETDLTSVRAGAASATANNVLYVFGGTENETTVQSLDFNPPVIKQLCVLLYRGEETQLSVSNYLIDNRDMTWTSSDTAVAEVDADGKVRATGIGLAEITAVNKAGTYQEMIPVKVVKEEPRLAVHLATGQKAKLYLVDDPSTVTWTSMDESVAVVASNGEVTAVGKGLVIIKAVLDSEEYNIYVRVNP